MVLSFVLLISFGYYGFVTYAKKMLLAESFDNQYLQKVYSICQKGTFYLSYPSTSTRYPEISNLARYLIIFKAVSMRLVGVTVILSLIVIPSMKKSTYNVNALNYQYSWFVSSAFISGKSVAQAILACWLIICTCFHVAIIYSHECEKRFRVIRGQVSNEDFKYEDGTPNKQIDSQICDDSDNNDPDSNILVYLKSLRSFVSNSTVLSFVVCVFAISLNIGFVIVVNYVYVYYRPSFNKKVYFAVIFAVTVFKLFWFNVVIGKWCSMLREAINLSWLKAMFIRVFIFVVSSLMVPVVITMLVDSSCFAELFQSAERLTVDYSFLYCTNVDPSLNCVGYSVMNQTISYTLPFIYNNGCSSAVMQNYINILIYTYCFNCLVTPVCYFVFSYISASKFPEIMRKRMLPGAIWPKDASMFAKMIRLDNLIASKILHLTTVITFGFSSPPVAIIAGATVFMELTTWQIILGRCIKYCDDSSTPESDLALKRLSEECQNCWRAPRKCLLLILSICSIFFALFVTDVASDRELFVNVIWMPIMCILYPYLLYLFGKSGFLDIKGTIDNFAMLTITGFSFEQSSKSEVAVSTNPMISQTERFSEVELRTSTAKFNTDAVTSLSSNSST